MRWFSDKLSVRGERGKESGWERESVWEREQKVYQSIGGSEKVNSFFLKAFSLKEFSLNDIVDLLPQGMIFLYNSFPIKTLKSYCYFYINKETTFTLKVRSEKNRKEMLATKKVSGVTERIKLYIYYIFLMIKMKNKEWCSGRNRDRE